jgi:hypothetical protein
MFDLWLLFNANSAIFQLYHGENKLIFSEKMNMILQILDFNIYSHELPPFFHYSFNTFTSLYYLILHLIHASLMSLCS